MMLMKINRTSNFLSNHSFSRFVSSGRRAFLRYPVISTCRPFSFSLSTPTSTSNISCSQVNAKPFSIFTSSKHQIFSFSVGNGIYGRRIPTFISAFSTTNFKFSHEEEVYQLQHEKKEETPTNQRKVAWWLLICAGMCFSMVTIGGVTRLTESGLSITEWKPFRGAMLPLSEEEWQREFSKYKKSPEYLKLNFGMSLAEFKKIYLMEWFHRQWGRVTGFVFALPFLYFMMKVG